MDEDVPMVDRKQVILEAVSTERSHQDGKWGEQNHTLSFWMTILMEEVGEAARATFEIEAPSLLTEKKYEDRLWRLEEELIQVAAVAVAIIECMWRNKHYTFRS